MTWQNAKGQVGPKPNPLKTPLSLSPPRALKRQNPKLSPPNRNSISSSASSLLLVRLLSVPSS